MIKKSPRLHQNYMQAYRDRSDILNQEIEFKSEFSKELESLYKMTINLPVFKMAAHLEELLLQVRAMENMDEIKFGESGSYKFARTAFPRLDVKGQHLRVYVNDTKDLAGAANALKEEMNRLIQRNRQLLEMDTDFPKFLVEIMRHKEIAM